MNKGPHRSTKRIPENSPETLNIFSCILCVISLRACLTTPSHLSFKSCCGLSLYRGLYFICCFWNGSCRCLLSRWARRGYAESDVAARCSHCHDHHDHLPDDRGNESPWG